MLVHARIEHQSAYYRALIVCNLNHSQLGKSFMLVHTHSGTDVGDETDRPISPVCQIDASGVVQTAAHILSIDMTGNLPTYFRG